MIGQDIGYTISFLFMALQHIQSLDWKSSRGKIIHNPVLTDVPPHPVAWRNERWKRSTRELSRFYLREAIEYESGIHLFGVTDSGLKHNLRAN